MTQAGFRDAFQAQLPPPSLPTAATQFRAGPRKDGLDEALVPCAVRRELRFDQSVRDVQAVCLQV